MPNKKFHQNPEPHESDQRMVIVFVLVAVFFAVLLCAVMPFVWTVWSGWAK